MEKIKFKKSAALTMILVLLPVLALAYNGKGRERGQHGPPQVAIDACDGKIIGDSVEFTGRRDDTISGTCQEMNGQLVAVPEGHRGKGRR